MGKEQSSFVGVDPQKLEQALFDVELVDLFAKTNLFQGKGQNALKASGHKAVVNVRDGELIGVVSKKHRIISNKEALDLGREAFVNLFPQVKKVDLIPFNIILPKNLAFCHIDLGSPDIILGPWDLDRWLPFLRITNSYNKMFPLTLELGFVRQQSCSAVVLDKEVVKVSFPKKNQPAEFCIDPQRMRKVEWEFFSNLEKLKQYYLDQKLVFPAVCKALGLTFNIHGKDERNNERELERQQLLKKRVEVLVESYYPLVGHNAYALFCIMTDLVSNQENYDCLKSYSFMVSRLFTKVSKWMKTFIEQMEKKRLTVDEVFGDQTLPFSSFGT